MPEDEVFLRRSLEVGRNGSLEDLLALWAPGERDQVRSFFAEGSTFEQNRATFRGMTASRLRLRMAYGHYVLYFLEHVLANGRSFLQGYTTLRNEQGMFFTNRLQSDQTLIVLRHLAQSVLVPSR